MSDRIRTLLVWAVYAICILTPFMVIPPIHNFSNLAKDAATQIGTTLAFLLLILYFLTASKYSVRKSEFNLPLILLILWSTISLSYSLNAFEGFVIVRRYLCALTIFFVISNVFSKNETDRLLRLLFCSATLVALLGIGQYLFAIDIIQQLAPPASTFANKNMAAQFLILTLPLGITFYLESKKSTSTWFFSIASGLCLIYLIYTRTRAGWVAFSVQTLFILFVAIKHRFVAREILPWNKHKKIALLASLAMIFIMVNIGPQGTHTGVTTISSRISTITPSNNKVRLAIWENSLAMIKDNPIVGVGLGNLKVHYPRYNNKVASDNQFSLTRQLHNAHNDYLQIWAELGIIGFMIFLLTGLLFLSKLKTIVFDETSFEKKPLWGLGILTGLLGISITALFSFPLQLATPLFFIFVFLGSLQIIGPKDFYSWKVPKRLLIYLGIGISIVLPASTIYHLRLIGADYNYFQALNSELNNEWKKVLYHSGKAHYYSSADKRILTTLGSAKIALSSYESGIKDLENVLMSYPHLPNALLNLSIGYEQTNQLDSAVGMCQRAVEILPNYADAHSRLGQLHIKTGKYEQAINAYKQALLLNEKNTHKYLYNIGLAQLKQGDSTAAINSLQSSITFQGDWPPAYRLLAQAYEKENETELSETALSQALNLEKRLLKEINENN